MTEKRPPRNVWKWDEKRAELLARIEDLAEYQALGLPEVTAVCRYFCIPSGERATQEQIARDLELKGGAQRVSDSVAAMLYAFNLVNELPRRAKYIYAAIVGHNKKIEKERVTAEQIASEEREWKELCDRFLSDYGFALPECYRRHRRREKMLEQLEVILAGTRAGTWNRLTPIEQRILEARFALRGQGTLPSLEGVAKTRGIPYGIESVRQYEIAALEKLGG